MKKLIFFFFCFLIFTYTYAQTEVDSAYTNNEKYQKIYLGDHIYLKGDTTKYTVTNIFKKEVILLKIGEEQTVILKKSKNTQAKKYKITNAKNELVANKKLSPKIQRVESANYLKRRNQLKFHGIYNFRGDAGRTLGIVTNISKFTNKIEMDFVDENGNIKTDLITFDEIIDEENLTPKSDLDSLLWMEAILHWINNVNLFSCDNKTTPEFSPIQGDTLNLKAIQFEASDNLGWKRLVHANRYSKKDWTYKCNLPVTWNYKNERLNIWATGNCSTSPEIKKHKDKSQIKTSRVHMELTLRPLFLSNTSAQFVLEKKVFKSIPGVQHNYIGYGYIPEQKFDSLNVSREQVLYFADVVKLKNDANFYFIHNMEALSIKLQDINSSTSLSINRGNLRQPFEEIEEVVSHNYNGFLTFKNKFPIHSKVETIEGVGFVWELDFIRKLATIGNRGRNGNMKSQSRSKINFEQLNKVNYPKTFADSIEIMLAAESWKSNTNIIDVDQLYFGSLLINKGDKLNFYSSTDFSYNSPKATGQNFRLLYMDSNVYMRGLDLYKKREFAFEGTWEFNSGILTLWLLGNCRAWNLIDRKTNAKSSVNNNWRHVIKMKVLELDDNHLEYEIIHVDSVLINSLK